MARKKKRPLSPKQKRLDRSTQDRKKKESNFSSTFIDWLNSIRNKASVLAKYSHYLEIFALIIIIVIGVFFRLDDLRQWHQYEQKAFFNNQPLHTTFDAWFYLSLAKDLVDGTYKPIDEKRGIPESPPRPSPPPLISIIAAGIAKITPFSLSWIGAVLPIILGPLLAIPLYLMGRYYGGPVMGIVASLMALLYPFYIYRSNLGRFDTDCMNVTWALSAAFLFLRFGIEKTKKRYIYFGGGIIVYVLFLWWWDQTPAVVGAITFLPLGVALAFFYRPERKETLLFFGILFVSAVLFLIIMGPGIPIKILKEIWRQFLYISKDSGGDFPNIGLTISEQKKPSLEMIVSYTTRNVLIFIFAIAGILWLFWKRFKEGLFLISLIVLSVITVSFANRFLIFMIPLVALGTGYALSTVWSLRQRFSPLYIICPLLIILFILPLYNSNKAYTQWPKESGTVVAGMDTAQKATPSDAVIWAWWDHGYALTYFARRATVNDGSIHSGERTVYTAIPFTTDNYRLAANFMQFYVIRGIKGIRKFYRATDNKPAIGMRLIKEILGAGPENGRTIIEKANLKAVKDCQTTDDWLKFFFPVEKRPIYLFLDNLLTKIITTVYWFGTWDIEKQDGKHPFYTPCYGIHKKGDWLISRKGLALNSKNGEVRVRNEKLRVNKEIVQLSHLMIRKKREIAKKSFHQNNGYRFEMLEQSQFGALMDANIAESVFNKLFIRHIFPKKYFRPVQLRPPHYQLWEVKGDSI